MGGGVEDEFDFVGGEMVGGVAIGNVRGEVGNFPGAWVRGEGLAEAVQGWDVAIDADENRGIACR